MKKLLASGLIIATLGTSAFGQVLLADGNSTANIDPTSLSPTFRRGMTSWSVDNVNQLFQQWYWFRIGNTAEASIDTISTPTVVQTSLNSARISYSNAVIALDVTFTLVGGVAGSNTADVGEIVRITNLTDNALDLHLFEYDDFDASGTSDDDRGAHPNAATIQQSDNNTMITVVGAPTPNHWQIAPIPDIFFSLDNGTATTLTDTGAGIGPEDLSFAMQWDQSLAARSSWIMSKNKIVSSVPEPSTYAAMGLGCLIVLRRRRK